MKELLLSRGKEQQELFELARNIRNNSFDNLAYIRAIIEPSNNCKNSCHYCAMNESGKIERYRMKSKEIVLTSDYMNAQGISVFSLETGEDKQILPEIIKASKKMKENNYWILGAFGDLKKDDYKKLRDVGMDAYLLKYETSNSKIFTKLRPGTRLKKRLQNLETLTHLGFKITTGNIVGLPGQSFDDLLNDIDLTRNLNPFSATVSPFIPSQGTPLEKLPYGNIDLTLNTLALYRILLPKTHIPALCALNFYSGVGQLAALNAGASDVLINTTSYNAKGQRFAIYSKNKKNVSLEDALKVIKDANLSFNRIKNSSI